MWRNIDIAIQMLMLKNRHVMCMGEWWAPWNYRVSQKFVPVISCTITFDQNFIFTWNCKMFIALSSSVTGMPPLFLYHKSHSETIAAWSGIHCVESQMILTILSFFITWYAGAFSNANNIFFRLSSWKKSIFWAFIQKKIIIQATTKTLFVLLYKFGMS